MKTIIVPLVIGLLPLLLLPPKFRDNTKQLLTFVEVNMFVCRPEDPILTEAIAEVNIMDIQVCKQTY